MSLPLLRTDDDHARSVAAEVRTRNTSFYRAIQSAMHRQRASETVYARGVIAPVHAEESSTTTFPKDAELFLETDGLYRWYEQGSPTDAFGETLREAVEAARREWSQFQIIEAEGHALTSESQFDLPERYAADDLEKRRED